MPFDTAADFHAAYRDWLSSNPLAQRLNAKRLRARRNWYCRRRRKRRH